MEIINGYVCHNCTDTALAARYIDPAHPKDGPFGRDKPKDPNDPAVILAGLLKGQPVGKAHEPVASTGRTVDVTA